jgi:hypothetical protein
VSCHSGPDDEEYAQDQTDALYSRFASIQAFSSLIADFLAKLMHLL